MMNIRRGEFLIIRGGKRKQLLARAEGNVRRKKEWPVRVQIMDQTAAYKSTRVSQDIYEPDVVANLGRHPAHGTAFGVRIEPFYEKHMVKRWGEVLFFIDLPDDQRERLCKTLTSCARKLNRAQLFAFTPIETHIRPKRGPIAGLYHTINKDGQLDKIELFMPTNLHEVKDMHALVYHEAGHGILNRQSNDVLRAAWVELYHEFTVQNPIRERKLERLVAGIAACQSIRQLKKNGDDEDAEFIDTIVDWVKDVHKIRPQDLEVMLRAGKAVEHLMPNPTEIKLILGKIESPVSKYSEKNAEELWCESFSQYMTNTTLPRKVHRLVERTIRKSAGIRQESL